MQTTKVECQWFETEMRTVWRIIFSVLVVVFVAFRFSPLLVLHLDDFVIFGLMTCCCAKLTTNIYAMLCDMRHVTITTVIE